MKTLDQLSREIRVCVLCRLHEARTHAVPGEGPEGARILLVGEAPGRQEDLEGRPFVGVAGATLATALEKAGLSRADVFVTNAVKCRPPENRRPRADELLACRPYLLSQIESLRPRVIVALGRTALTDLVGSAPSIERARRRHLTVGGTPVIATYHPASSRYARRRVKMIAHDLMRAAEEAKVERPYIRSGRPLPGKPYRPVHSSGAAVLDSRGRLLLLKRADEDIWCFPKGTLEGGETLAEAATREVREETGLEVTILQPIHEVHYEFYWPPDDVNVRKTVSYFLARPLRGSLRPEATFSRAEWCKRAEALRRVHYKNDRDVVNAAFDAIRPLTRRTRGPGRGASS